MIVYSYLMLSNKCKVVLEFLGHLREYLSYIRVAGPLDITAEVNNELYMPPAFLHLLFKSIRRAFDNSGASLSTQIDFFLYIVQLAIDTVDLLLPLGWIYLTL